jgi:hypothetical protein
MQQVPPKRLYTFARLHSVASQTTEMPNSILISYYQHFSYSDEFIITMNKYIKLEQQLNYTSYCSKAD